MSGAVNPGVDSALQTINSIDARLQRALSEVATGKAVATAADDPATYVIANRLGSDAQAFLAVNSGLGGAEVPTRVAAAAIGSTNDLLAKLQATVFEAQPDGAAATGANTQIQFLLSQIASNAAGATVDGVNLVAGAVVGDVKTTQISVPSNLDGATVTIGGKGLSQMNASVPGLGLDNFNATSDGIEMSFSSLSVENISTTPPATQIEVQTANYDSNPSPTPTPTPPSTGETPQYPGQSWTFVFTDASTPQASLSTNTSSDLAGNITHEDHTISVPLAAGFSLSDAVGALQHALYSANFETQFGLTPPFNEPTLSIAGNNVGTTATVSNLRPSFPIAIGQGSGQMTASVTLPATPIVGSLSIPSGVPLSSLNGATYLSTLAEINAYRSSNPTQPAFYLSPLSAGAAIAPGTTIASIDLVVPPVIPPTIPPTPPPPPAPPTYTITLSPPGAGAIPTPASIQMLVPLPSVPVESTSIWGGVAGAVATLNSALRKTGDMAQALGTGLNTLQQAEDNATQSVDLLNGGIGNLTDADMGKVSAQVAALQIQKQLAAQSLTLDNQGASLILELFK